MEKGKIKLEYCPTVDMVADALTKALARERHRQMMEKMGLEEVLPREGTATASRK